MHAKFTNELVHESSPYLQQHANNPVQWLPWGQKALDRAQSENKPIFLSIGYSSCHWCHVMEKESFMDEATAELLNEFFVPIKVDREERPDVDHIYMTALQSMTEQGGWPLNMFLTPNAEPFYGGTFFPKEDSKQIPSFQKVLKTIAHTWEQDATEIVNQSKHLTQHVRGELNRILPTQEVPDTLLQSSIAQLESHADRENGGFFSAPKFPHAFYLDLYTEALRAQAVDDPNVLAQSLCFSLRKMAQGGIYDHLAGGFHRYSTDSEWLVPHFEKMLYDNAILAQTYLQASKIVDTHFNKSIGLAICDYVLSEMTHPEGMFYSSTDADTDGVEGKFFVWTKPEILQVLGEKDGETFCAIYNITQDAYAPFDPSRGTPPHEWFEGHVLHLQASLESILHQHQYTEDQLQVLRAKLWEHRKATRTAPFRDEKILSSWNGLMVQALTMAYEVSGNMRYFEAAKNALDSLWVHLIDSEQRLNTTWKDGKAQHQGTLEDYANMIAALLAYHRIGGSFTYLERAQWLCEKAVKLFWDEEEGFFYYTVPQADLIVRAKNLFDQALPSAHSVMASNIFYLGRIFDDVTYHSQLGRMLSNLTGFIVKTPHAVSSLIKIYHRNLRSAKDYVLVGASECTRRKLLQLMLPEDILLTEKDATLALVRDKLNSPEATLYICHDQHCEAPIRGEETIRFWIENISHVEY